MRFPSFTDLDREQRAIYSGAPLGESILVMGPPGTGKTVMAFHRAERLKTMATSKKAETAKPRVIMYNKVLATYSSDRGDVAQGVPSSTMHSWVWHWYKRVAGRQPPNHPDDKYLHDWMTMLPVLLEKVESNPNRVHWGHLIIDEGQDFPEGMYQTLSAISSTFPPREEQGQYPPVVTVFADDNQRLASTNSTLQQIQDALGLKGERVFSLKKNYRNNKQIAEFGRYFYVGLRSGIPDLPTKVGQSLPRVVLASSLEVVRRRIANYAINNPHMDIGVLCSANSVRKQVYNSLNHRLAGTTSVVQTYAYADRQEHPPEDLVFDQGGSITVLNFQSAKGLEFDAVFIIDPFDGSAGASNELSRMQMYVMASRARHYLEILLMNPPSDLEDRLPPKELYEKVEE